MLGICKSFVCFDFRQIAVGPPKRGDVPGKSKVVKIGSEIEKTKMKDKDQTR